MTDEELSATLKIAKAFMDGHDVGAQSADLFYGAMVAGADRLAKATNTRAPKPLASTSRHPRDGADAYFSDN